jgi:hypothetical protein
MKISGKVSLINSFILRNNITGDEIDNVSNDDESQKSTVLLHELQKNIEMERKLDERREKLGGKSSLALKIRAK